MISKFVFAYYPNVGSTINPNCILINSEIELFKKKNFGVSMPGFVTPLSWGGAALPAFYRKSKFTNL